MYWSGTPYWTGPWKNSGSPDSLSVMTASRSANVRVARVSVLVIPPRVRATAVGFFRSLTTNVVVRVWRPSTSMDLKKMARSGTHSGSWGIWRTTRWSAHGWMGDFSHRSPPEGRIVSLGALALGFRASRASWAPAT